MDPERLTRVELIAGAVRAGLGAVPGADALQRHLFEQGIHGMDAVLVTMRVLGVGLGEANAAYFGSPLRAADRELQESFLDALELAAETDARQRRLCAELQAVWTPPAGGSVVRVARDVGTGRWPVNGARQPVEGRASGWCLWAGEGQPDQSPDCFAPVEVEDLYERCPEVLPYLGLPPGWQFLIAPGRSESWHGSKSKLPTP